MGFPVILTPQSQEDLGGIIRYLRTDSPERAKTFGDALIDEALAIGRFPEIGRMIPELRDPAVREIVHGSYRIIYEVRHKPTVVYVLRFWHAARGAPDLGPGHAH